MKRILISAFTVFAVAAMVAGATQAVFSDQAVLGDNTVTAGSLEIRLNGQERLAGLSMDNAAPGDVESKVFSLQNYGQPHFGGPSTLDADEIVVSSTKTAGDNNLYNKLEARLYANAGWGGCSNADVTFVAGKGCEVYNGLLKDMTEEDVLHATQWGATPVLAHGNSLTMTLDVQLPSTVGNGVQGETTTFDLLFDAYTPHRT
ncbi:MAG: TasA family protein [bacterium]|nr:TasA family protein [bacterium]